MVHRRCFADGIGLGVRRSTTGTPTFPSHDGSERGAFPEGLRLDQEPHPGVHVGNLVDARRRRRALRYGLDGSGAPLGEFWEHDDPGPATHFRVEPEPMVRMLLRPDLIQIVVAGSPGRNQSKAFFQQNRQGPPITRKVRTARN